MATLRLYAHPFSSYSQKVLIALYENATPFTYRTLEDPSANAELAALWPLKRFPVLVDGDRTVVEATCVIEHLHAYHRGPVPMIPDDTQAALDARMMDRFFDNYISTPLQTVVYEARRDAAQRDPHGAAQARDALEQAYSWLDGVMAEREWAIGDAFTLADCSAAPSLFYADWTHEIAPRFAHVRAYRSRLLQRPSFAKLVEEARPFRAYFPLGAPDRD